MTFKPTILIGNLMGVVIVAITIVFIYIKFSPVDVLKDWTLSVPSGTYHQGQEVVAHTEVDKVRPVSAHAHRNIECRNKAGSFVSYHLADVIGGNSRVGHISADIPFIIPLNIPDLPADCRFSIAAAYSVYSFRQVNEYTASNTFLVVP